MNERYTSYCANNKVLSTEYFLNEDTYTLEELEIYKEYCESIDKETFTCITKKKKKYFLDVLYPRLKRRLEKK